MNISAIIQARMGSKRLPGKVLKKIKNKTVLHHIIDRLNVCKNINMIIVATTTNEKDNAIASWCKKHEIKYYRGDEDDVLGRFINAATTYSCDIIVRVTADDPFIDPNNIDLMIKSHLKYDADVTYTDNMPVGCGLGMIVISNETLKSGGKDTKDGHKRYREHVDEYFLDHPEKYKINIMEAPEHFKRSHYRLTLDTDEDWNKINHVFDILYDGNIIELSEVVRLLDQSTVI